MDVAIKIAALEEFCSRQQHRNNAEAATHAAGMVSGLKHTLHPDFDYNDALVEASMALQTVLTNKQSSPLDIERATGFFSGIIFSESHDVAEAQAIGYKEREALLRLLDNTPNS
jgi:hypothetical protein